MAPEICASVRTGDTTSAGVLVKDWNTQAIVHDVQAQAQITQEFGAGASNAWGRYANDRYVDAIKNGDENAAACWAPSGGCRAGGHVVIGGLTGGPEGAAAAGLSSTLAPEFAAFLRDNDVPEPLAQALTIGLATGVGAGLGGAEGAAKA